MIGKFRQRFGSVVESPQDLSCSEQVAIGAGLVIWGRMRKFVQRMSKCWIIGWIILGTPQRDTSRINRQAVFCINNGRIRNYTPSILNRIRRCHTT